MKFPLRFLLSLTAVVLYCFTWGGVVERVATAPLETVDHTVENSSSIRKIHLYGLAETVEQSVGTSKNAPTPSLKNWGNEQGNLAAKSTYTLVVPRVAYASFLRNFPISFKKVDIIFPFHYFW